MLEEKSIPLSVQHLFIEDFPESLSTYANGSSLLSIAKLSLMFDESEAQKIDSSS